MVKYGVVGTGYLELNWLDNMQKNDGAEITVVYDPENTEAVAERRSENCSIVR